MGQRHQGRPIRVLVIPDKYRPDQCAGGAIYSDLCRGLADRGLDVTVRCPYPFYPEWRDKSGRNGWRIERTVEDGVTVERFGFFIPRNPKSVWQRMLLDVTFFLSLSRSLVSRRRYDAVIAFCPHSGGVAFAALYKMLFGGPMCLSVMDLPADAALASGITCRGRLQGLLQVVQKTLFNFADVWRSISPVMVERLEGLRTRDQPVVLIPDWIHPSIKGELRRLPSKIGRPASRPVRLLYSGNIGAKQGLLEFCRALHAGPVPFFFQIHGDGGMAAEVRDWVASAGDPRFSIGPLVDEPRFARDLHDADLFVVTEKPHRNASFFPSKIIPGMISGTPILAVSSPESPLGCEVREYGLGPWFPWDRCGAVAELLATLESRPEDLVTWQRNANRRGEFFERDRWIDLFEQTMIDMVQDRSLARTHPAAITS